jgi:hypothetical protein
MRIYFLLLTLCLAFSLALAQDTNAPGAPSPDVVEVAKEPAHHQVLENEFVRVFGVNVPPHRTTLMHRHGNDYLTVAFGHSAVTVTSGAGKVSSVVFEDGDVRYSAGGIVHAVNNPLDTPFSNWTIELLQNQGHPVCVNDCANDARAKDWPPLTEESKVIGYGDSFRISLATVKPRQIVSTHEPFPHLVIFLTDLQGHAGQPGSGSDFKQKRGDIMFHGPHPNGPLTNAGDQEVRIIELEFKPAKNGAAKE